MNHIGYTGTRMLEYSIIPFSLCIRRYMLYLFYVHFRSKNRNKFKKKEKESPEHNDLNVCNSRVYDGTKVT